MKRIKSIWCIKNYNHELLIEINQLNKKLYSNLYQSNNMTDLCPKNSILKNEINSLFQNILFDFLYEEQELYEYYDNKFNNHNYNPRNINLPFKSFIIYFKNLYLDINSDKSKLDCLKKIRWYIFSFDKVKKNINFKNDLFKSSIMMMDIEEEDNNDIYNDQDNDFSEYNSNLNLQNNNKENNIDYIKEKDENIIDNDYIDNMLSNEDNPLFYILKLLFLSISSFCKETICYLLTTFNNDNNLLINNYSKRFDNFVNCAKIINSECENINVVINYLYKELFTDYPNFPKFSIFRLFIKIWYKESTSYLIQNNNMTLLNKLKNSTIELYSKIIKDDIINIQNEPFISNSNNILENNNFFKNNEKLCLSSSISVFNSENLNPLDNDFNSYNFIPFGSLYDENNSKYYIVEKGLKIIYDSFCNEFNVNLLNLSNIDVNNYYNDIENNICEIIQDNIKKCFEKNLIEKGISIKLVIKHILSKFQDYFYENRIIPKLKIQIFNIVYKSLIKNIFDSILYLFQQKNKNESKINDSYHNFSSFGESQNTNYSSFLESKSSINILINIDDDISNNNDHLNELKNYIIKQYKNNDDKNEISIIEINNFIEELNNKDKIIELFNNIDEWKNKNDNIIIKLDKKVQKELNKKNLENKYNNIQRQLFSYSIESDIDFIEKIKSNQKENINHNKNKSNIFDDFNDYKTFNDFNNLKPFYNELNNNEFNMNNINNINYKDIGNSNSKLFENNIDIDIGKSVFNLDLNNNFFNGYDKNNEDINPYNIQNENENNFNNFNYENELSNLNNIQGENYFLNNYNLNDLNPYNDYNRK